MSDSRWFAAHVTQVDVDECWEMVESREIGRVGYVDEAGPMVMPVTFTVHERTVVFRVAPYSALGKNVPNSVIAFEVDEIDDVTRSGWSVLLRGRVDVVHPDEVPSLPEPPVPWAEGRRALYLRLDPVDVTGRRLMPA